MESIQTQTEIIESKRGRGRPRIHFEIKIKKPIGRPIGSFSTTVKRTDVESREHRRVIARKYFENNPEQVEKAKESYRQYYERNKIEINRKRMEKKNGIKMTKS